MTCEELLAQTEQTHAFLLWGLAATMAALLGLGFVTWRLLCWARSAAVFPN